jgi:class 3 adenylate cyclase
VGSAAETRYAKHGGVHIAYQVIGDGPRDVVVMPNWATNVEAIWDDPPQAQFLDGMSSFGRVILFDKRGIGLSDPVPLPHLPTLEEWLDDLRSVMDAADSKRAAIVAADTAGFIAMMAASIIPERTSALVLVNSAARLRRAGDYPAGIPDRVVDAFLQTIDLDWGSGKGTAALTAPSHGDDPAYVARGARYERLTASPATMRAMTAMLLEVDLRPVLPTISCPTLIIHRTGDRYMRVEHGRYLAEHIPGATLRELPGDDHWIAEGDLDAMLEEIENFLTGVRRGPAANRVLATVLFTDIVGSTEHLADIGDRRWRQLLDRHDEIIDRLVERFHGRRVNTTGDGAVVTFDGPARAVRCAVAIRDGLSGLGMRARAGLHVGEIEMRGSDLAGLAVHVAQRISTIAQPDEVLVSRTVVDLVSGSGIRFVDRGHHQLKGVPDAWRLFAVDG